MTSSADDSHRTSGRTGKQALTGLIVGAIVWMGVAFALYRPHLNRPYEVQDFPDLLPMIRASTSPVQAIITLSEYLLSHGRLNLVVVSQLVLKWTLLGENMALWHLARAVEMALLAGLIFVLLRRLGCTRAGAFAASTITLASPAAALSWTRMAIGEPIGAIVLVLLCLLLCAGPDARFSLARYVALALTVIVLGLTKEVLLIAVPVVTLGIVGIGARERVGLLFFLRDRRVRWVMLGGILVSVPILLAALQAPPQAYSNHFGIASATAANFAMPFLATLLPFALTSSPLSAIELLSLAAYVAGMVGVWGLVMKDRSLPGRRWLLLLGLGLPAAGALVYTPWPKYRLYYALPFQLGTAVLVGIAVSRLFDRSSRVRAATLAICALIAVPMLTFAQGYLSFLDASRVMTRDTAVWLGRLPGSAAATVEICGLPLQHFSGYDHFLPSYSLSLGLAPPPVQPAPCAFGNGREGQHRSSWRVMLSDRMPPATSGGERVVYVHEAFDLRRFRFQPDSIVVTTWPPA